MQATATVIQMGRKKPKKGLHLYSIHIQSQTRKNLIKP